MDRELEPSLFMQYVASSSKELRDASVEADKSLNEWNLKSLMRVDVYETLVDAENHTKENGVKLNDEEERLMKRLILDRKRNGLGLDDDKRKELFEVSVDASHSRVRSKLTVSNLSSHKNSSRRGSWDSRLISRRTVTRKTGSFSSLLK